ncbi:hypothetical protein D3C71_1773320 [compost metagenome]
MPVLRSATQRGAVAHVMVGAYPVPNLRTLRHNYRTDILGWKIFDGTHQGTAQSALDDEVLNRLEDLAVIVSIGNHTRSGKHVFFLPQPRIHQQ